MTFRRLYISLAFLTQIALFTSCEEPVKGDIGIPEAKLVISSNFYPNEVVKVGVSSTFSLLSNQTEVSVAEADVRLFTGNELIEELAYQPSSDGQTGFYATTDYKPQIGVRYTISVAADGFTPVVAVSSIPPPVPIRLFELEEVTKDVQGNRNRYRFNVKIDYDDPEGEVNFYNLRMVQQFRHFELAFNGDTIFTGSSNRVVEFPEPLMGEYIVAANNGGILIQDRPAEGYLSFAIETGVDPSVQLLGNLYAELRTVSPEYFFFQQSISRESGSSTGGSGVNPSTVVQSNVENGTGIFAGYAITSDSLYLGDE